jgi:hypothetical protein
MSLSSSVSVCKEKRGRSEGTQGHCVVRFGSAVLELVDFVRKENIKGLISYLVERFYDNTFDKIDYVETFKQLKLKYDQVQEGATGGAAAGGAATATQNAREVLMANRRCALQLSSWLYPLAS